MIYHSNLNDLTPGVYMAYKKQRYSEARIAQLYNVKRHYMQKWRQAHGITIDPDMNKWPNFEKVFPDEVKRLKRNYMKYHNQGWMAEHCGAAIGLTPGQTFTFRRYFLPELLSKPRRLYTPEEVALMEKNGLSRDLVTNRRREGWTLEAALNTPNQNFSFTKYEKQKIKRAGLTTNRVVRRIKSGWNRETAITKPTREKRANGESNRIMQKSI